MGVAYFKAVYGRSNDIFGAMPSLHVSYPVLMFLEGWRWLAVPGRCLLAGFAALMCFAAVYLDHHWIVDVLMGLALSSVAYVMISRLVPDEDT